MIYKGGKEITGINIGGKSVVEVYKGLRLVWQSVRSCFGRGYWVNAKPWSNTDGWRNEE